jgi:hypothetical protein
MRRYFASVVLVLTVPAFATIAPVQHSPLASVSNSSTCSPNLSSSTIAGDLLVVWATWTPGNTVSITTVFDQQTLNSFPSAVGPTLQANASPQIGAQIFYAKNIHGNTGGDNITVQFSGTATTASCVAVEYSGADQNYPLDSVSAGHSYSAGSLLDSGTVAPANANLLVFGAGATDSSSTLFLTVGNTGFASIVANANVIAEQDITTSANNTLQRAPANGDAGHPGNWVMQMAVFRDASWAVTGGSNPARPAQIQFADQFPGTDACVRAQTAANTTINGVLTMVVDSRGEITNGIPCATPPQFGVPGMSSAGGEWLLPMGQIQINTPLFVFGKTTYQGACISYDIAHCSGLVSNWASGTGGLSGVSVTGGPAWASGTNYFVGGTATNGGFTWYSVQNNNKNHTPGTGQENWWSRADFFPSPVAFVNSLVNAADPANADTESYALKDLSLNCAYQGGATNISTLGCAGFINSWGQEQGRVDNVKIQNPTVAGYMVDSNLTEDNGPNGGGTIGYGVTSQQFNDACRVSGPDTSQDHATISSTSVTTVGGNTLLKFVLSSAPTSGPWKGQVIDVVNGPASLSNIAAGVIDETGNTHGLWQVYSVTDSTHITAQAPSGQAACLSSCGTGNFFPIGLNVTYDGTAGRINQNRGYHNWTINATTCATASFTATVSNSVTASMSLGTATFLGTFTTTGVFPGTLLTGTGFTPAGYNVNWTVVSVTGTTITATHAGTSGLGPSTVNGTLAIGPPTPSEFLPIAAAFSMQDSPFTDSHIEGHRVGVDVGSFAPSTGEHLKNLINVTNMYTGVLIDNKFPVVDLDIQDLTSANSGPNPNVYTIVDLKNGNFLTTANNSYVKHYWLDANSTAYLEGGNCADMTKGYCLSNGVWIPAGNTFSSDGGCLETSLSGGPASGKFKINRSSCTIVITMGNSLTAKNGWSCWANDETHAFSVGYRQTASTITTASILMTGTTSDVIDFGCAPY